uniref:SCP domain-containing protein n=1 Tax=Oncorhynchus kisutch TaxID=8019 RepID=A0A8C7K1G5_ONCKI
MGQLLLQRWLWAVIFLGSSVPNIESSEYNPFPGITDKKFIDDCVRIHNDNRSSVNPPARNMLYMTWDEGLAITARAWARHCDFQHNIYLKEVRRNIGQGPRRPTFSVMQAMDLWVKEVNDYSYQSNACKPRKMCGHYTQVVWATSYKVGCAVQICPNASTRTSFSDKEGAIFVCNYAEAGNVVEMLPYQNRLEECSSCEGANNQCQAKLCHNPKRDEQKSYRWTPDWDPTLATCGPCCMAILAIRPLALLLTFVAAFGVHRLYPSIFFYE